MNSEKVKVSVIISTFERESYLKKVVGVVFGQKVNFRVELIVVDASKANTIAEMVNVWKEEYESGLFCVRYIRQVRGGLSVARNMGCLAAKGEILVFIDDDTVPSGRSWLSEMVDVMSKSGADVAYGKILHDKELSDVFDKDLRGLLTYSDRGDKELMLGVDDVAPPAAHMAIKRSLLVEVGGFLPCLGRYKQCLLSGEDDELYNYLISIRKKIVYSPKLLVVHKILAERLRVGFFRKRLWWQGRTDVVFNKVTGRSDYTLSKVGYFMLRAAVLRVVELMRQKDSIKWGKENERAVYYFAGRVYQGLIELFKNREGLRPADIYKNLE